MRYCKHGTEARSTLTRMLEISFPGTSSNLSNSLYDWKHSMTCRAYSFMIIRPNPYHKPPCPTRFESFTLRASAFNAMRTLAWNGGGMLKSAKSLPKDAVQNAEIEAVVWTNE